MLAVKDRGLFQLGTARLDKPRRIRSNSPVLCELVEKGIITPAAAALVGRLEDRSRNVYLSR
jgi:hypothetical protein